MAFARRVPDRSLEEPALEKPEVSDAAGPEDPLVTVPIAPSAPVTTVPWPVPIEPPTTGVSEPPDEEPEPEPDPVGTDGAVGLGAETEGTVTDGTVTPGTGVGTAGVDTDGVDTVGTETVGGAFVARTDAWAPGRADMSNQVRQLSASTATPTAARRRRHSRALSQPHICLI